MKEDFEKLPKKDRSWLTNACDKQFTSLDDFKVNAIGFLEREDIPIYFVTFFLSVIN
ncbi:MAG: hypothetical protein HW421_2075 [Ignavibacteria bacterium]|nr:hypothetical protein [Ignavibacteria bacterium]